MEFHLNLEKFQTICALRGWKYPATDLAKAIGFTRSYTRRVLLEKAKLSEIFMLRYMKLAGVNPKRPSEWGSLFNVNLDGDIPIESTKLNNEKIHGRHPYVHFSPSFAMRGDDPDLEEESFREWISRKRKSWPQPVNHPVT